MLQRLQSAVLGDLPAFADNPIGFIEERAIGPLAPVPIRFGPKAAVLVARPSAVRHVLVDGRDRYDKGSEQARLRPLFGEGMVTASGDRWQASRETTKGAFSAAGLNDGLNLAIAILAEEVASLGTRIGKPLLLHPLMGRLAMRMAVAALFQARLEDKAADDLYAAGLTVHQRLSESMWRLIDIDAILWTLKNREFRKAIQVFEELVAEIAKAPKGVLAMLYPVTDRYGPSVLRDEAVTMLVAGFETTATAACWLAYVLACQPYLVDYLRDELDPVISRDGWLSPAALRDIPRTRATVQEALRLYPSAWWFARRAIADDVIDGLKVSKGTSVLICPWALHRQPDLWPAPSDFSPSRFLRRTPIEKFAYVPFGAGPRACVGTHLASAELVGIAAMLVSAFDLEPLSGPFEDLKPIGGVTLGAPQDLQVRLHLRAPVRTSLGDVEALGRRQGGAERSGSRGAASTPG